MRCAAVLTVLWLSSLTYAADAPTATVTGRTNGKVVTFPKGIGTLVQGSAIATVGTAQFESDADKDKWEFAIKRDHILVSFTKPQGLAANIQGDKDDGKVHEVSELHGPHDAGDGGLASGPGWLQILRVRQV
jgi:hypothetical protein